MSRGNVKACAGGEIGPRVETGGETVRVEGLGGETVPERGGEGEVLFLLALELDLEG